jgi:catechol 2,3-dioxygenase-like lactoylglutathione lyase family enzyme
MVGPHSEKTNLGNSGDVEPFYDMRAQPVFYRIDSVVIRVRDRAPALDWYRSRLGLRLLFEDREAGLAILDMGRGDTITLWQLQADEIAPARGIAGIFPVFEAIDAAAERAELIMRGVTTSELREFPRARCFTFWDLDGNRLEACEVIAPENV